MEDGRGRRMADGDGGWMGGWKDGGLACGVGVWAFCFCFPVVRALCTTPKPDLHLYVVLRTSSRKVKPSKSYSLVRC